MEANFDGMRRIATANMNVLGKFLEEEILIMDNYYIDDEIKEKLVKVFNDAAQSVDVMNCLYDDAVVDDMNDLSEVLEITPLKLVSIEDDDNETMRSGQNDRSISE